MGTAAGNDIDILRHGRHPARGIDAVLNGNCNVIAFS
jgi:hypothetical protein